MPCGISSRSSTAPLSGSMRRMSLSSPSQVPCHSSPSTQVTPVTKRLDSIVRMTLPVAGIDLVDLAVAVLPDPQAALGPGQARVAALAGCRDRGHHVAGGGIDLVDARFGDLVEMRAVERGAGIAGAVERACDLAARRIERDELGAGGGPDALAVVGDAADALDAGERPVLAHDLGRRAPVLRRSPCLSCLAWVIAGSL